MSEWRPYEPSLEAAEAAQRARITDNPELRPVCHQSCPRGWTGHWREFHRGHGCKLDPTP